MTPLETATTDELLSELESRFEAFIVAGVRSCDESTDDMFASFKGTLITCLGLTSYARRKVQRELKRCEDRNEEGDR